MGHVAILALAGLCLQASHGLLPPPHYDAFSRNKAKLGASQGESPSMIGRRYVLFSSWGLILVGKTSGAIALTDEPTEAAVLAARHAFAAFDTRDLDEAEVLFSKAVSEWRLLEGRKAKRDELCALLTARANVRVDLKRFGPAISDFDEAIALMASDGRRADGRAAYFEYADAFAQRGLAHEGLAGRDEQRAKGVPPEVEWRAAIADYDEALGLWGAGGASGGLGPNPYVLTYRGNAKAALGEYDGALQDFRGAFHAFSDFGFG